MSYPCLTRPTLRAKKLNFHKNLNKYFHCVELEETIKIMYRFIYFRRTVAEICDVKDSCDVTYGGYFPGQKRGTLYYYGAFLILIWYAHDP